MKRKYIKKVKPIIVDDPELIADILNEEAEAINEILTECSETASEVMEELNANDFETATIESDDKDIDVITLTE